MKKTLLAVALIPFLTLPAMAESNSGTISVNGVGSVTMAPDLAIVSAGVQTRAKTAQDAVQQNNKKMAALFAELEKAGVAKKDIQTSDFNIHPHMVYPKHQSEKPPSIAGYNVNNQVTVKIRKLESVGSVLTTLVNAGANNMSGLRFDVSNKAEKLDDARKAAIADAKQKATLYATELGAKLKKLRSLSEGHHSSPQPVYARAAKMEMLASAPVPVAEGSMDLTITVSTTWELDN